MCSSNAFGISEPEMTIMIFYEKDVAIWMMSVRVPRKQKRHSKGLNSRKLYTGDVWEDEAPEAGNSWETISTYRSEGQGGNSVSWGHGLSCP